MAPALRRAVAHAFVTDLAAPALADEDRHHLEKALRLRPGQMVTVADGLGGWRPCAWGPGGALDPTGEVVRDPEPAPPVTVGLALAKGDRPEWAVQKLTEVGVDRILAVEAARSVVRWEADDVDRRLGRWRRVAREAAMQARRSRLPVVEGVFPVADAVTELARRGPAPAVLAEPGGAPPSLDHPAVLVGPEGGWSPEELALGSARMDLGPTVLRTETAALWAGTVLCALRAGLVRPTVVTTQSGASHA